MESNSLFGQFDQPAEKKKCRKCGIVKNAEEFHRRPSLNNGLTSWCRECSKKHGRERYAAPDGKYKARCKAYRIKNKETIAAKRRIYQQENRERLRQYRIAKRERTRDAWLRLRHGVDLEWYNAVLARQNGVCAICKKPPSKKNLFVDHDHKTGRLRGLLCHRCNFGIGYLQDNIDNLIGALNYLEPEYVGKWVWDFDVKRIQIGGIDCTVGERIKKVQLV